MRYFEAVKRRFKGERQVSFIVGTGRCGTTMLAQMLNSHSKVCVPHELQILFEYNNNGPRLYEIFKDKKNEGFGSEDFIGLIKNICPHKFHEFFDYKSFFEKQRYPVRSLKELVNRLYAEIAESKNKNILIEQTPWYGQRIDILNELFPDAKYIHMIRDGRDVAISYARTPWWHNDIGRNLERWNFEVKQIINSAEKSLNPNQILQIRYEDFVENPERYLMRICAFLGVEFEDSMLDPSTYIDYGLYRKSATGGATPSSAMNEWAESKNAPTFKGSLYAWKSYPDFDFSAIPEHISRSLNAFGYETTTCCR